MAKRKLSNQFTHDWKTMMLALTAAALALYIGLLATTSLSHAPQVAGVSTTLGK